MPGNAFRALNRAEMAQRVARDIPEGWFVNLGFGMPTTVADHVPLEREVIFHSEQGVIGMGPAPGPGELNPWLLNASKQHVTLRTGGSYVHHAESFGMVRGGHIDLCVLGAYEVSETGDLSNWTTSDTDIAPSVGGAMDLAAGAKRLWVLMDHVTKQGAPKLVRQCSFPLTALAAVDRIYTNLAVIEVTPEGLVVAEMVPGMTLDTLQAMTGPPLRMAGS